MKWASRFVGEMARLSPAKPAKHNSEAKQGKSLRRRTLCVFIPLVLALLLIVPLGSQLVPQPPAALNMESFLVLAAQAASSSPPAGLRLVDRENAEHYTWGDKCDGWHLVKNANLSVIEESMPPGTSEVRHYHREAQQFFFVLSGQASLEADGEDLPLSAGQGASVLPGSRHRFHCSWEWERVAAMKRKRTLGPATASPRRSS
jgi:quercetin dioxygenase-like cupin family protein